MTDKKKTENNAALNLLKEMHRVGKLTNTKSMRFFLMSHYHFSASRANDIAKRV